MNSLKRSKSTRRHDASTGPLTGSATNLSRSDTLSSLHSGIGSGFGSSGTLSRSASVTFMKDREHRGRSIVAAKTEEAQTLLNSLIEKSNLFNKPEDVSETMIQDMFDLALEVRGENVTPLMRQLPKEKKITIIRQIISLGEESGKSLYADKGKSPQYYIHCLRSILPYFLQKSKTEQLVDLVARSITGTARSASQIKEIIIEVKVQCQCQSISWMDEFIDLGGLDVLFALLDAMHNKQSKRNKQFEIESEILKILRLIANHHVGITEPLYQQNYLNILIQSLDSPLLMARTATLDFLLAIVTLDYPNGHRIVIQALTFFQSIRDNLRIFDPLITALSHAVSSRGIFGSLVGASQPPPSSNTPNDFGSLISSFTSGFEKVKAPTEREMRDFLVSMVALIRFIVEVPDEYEYRMYLRNEFFASGIRPIFQKLKTWASLEFQDILQHVEAFEDMAASDFEYLAHNLNADADFDSTDPIKIVQVLQNNLAERDLLSVRSVLQHLLVGTTMMDPESRSKMLHLIDRVVTQMVLDQNGMTDFKETFQYAVDDIIAGLAELDRVEEECGRLRVICDMQEKELADNTKLASLSGMSIPVEELQDHYEKLKSISEYLTGASVDGVIQSRASAVAGTGEETRETPESKEVALSEAKVASTETLQSSEEQTISGVLPSSAPIPPPPPPPPMPMGVSGIPPPPPPPPMGGIPTISAPARIPAKYKPSLKLKKLHWEEVPHTIITKNTDCIWSNIVEKNDEMDDFLFEKGVFSHLESLFSAKPAPMMAKRSSSRDRPKDKNQSDDQDANTGPLKIVDEKRAQNIMIFLGTLRHITPLKLSDAIQGFDEKILNETILRQSLMAVPDENEEKLLRPVSNSNLRKAESFMVTLMKIYRPKPRIQCMLFLVTFQEHYDSLKMDIMSFTKALKSINESESLHKLLSVILSIGNYMNSGPGKSVGFKISLLEKLSSIKPSTFTGETSHQSALHVIIDTLLKHMPHVLHFIKDLDSLKSVTSLSISTIQDHFKELQKGFTFLSNEVQCFDTYSRSPLFSPVDRGFMDKAKLSHASLAPKMEFVRNSMHDLEEMCKKVLRYFGEENVNTNKLSNVEGYIHSLERFCKTSELISAQIKRHLEKSNAPKPNPTTNSGQQKPPSNTRSISGSSSSSTASDKEASGTSGARAMDSLLDKLKSRPITSDIHTRTPRRREPAHQKLNFSQISSSTNASTMGQSPQTSSFVSRNQNTHVTSTQPIASTNSNLFLPLPETPNSSSLLPEMMDLFLSEPSTSRDSATTMASSLLSPRVTKKAFVSPDVGDVRDSICTVINEEGGSEKIPSARNAASAVQGTDNSTPRMTSKLPATRKSSFSNLGDTAQSILNRIKMDF